MSLAITNLTANKDAADSATYATASVSPAATSLILVTVIAYSADPTGVAGGGLTFTLVNNTAYAGYNLSVWRAMGFYTPGAITITFASTRTYCIWSVEEATGVDTSGSNGAGAVVQSGVATSAALVTLSAFGSANNVAFGAWGALASITVGSGFGVLADNVNDSGHYGLTEYKANDNTVDISAGGMQVGGVALELKEGAAAATAADTGTLGATPTEDDALAGAKTVITTLTGDTFVAAGATFNAQRQAFIDHFVSAQSETAGWNAIRSNIAVTAVARTSDTVATLTLPVLPMNITANDVVTHTVPGEILTGAVDIIATPTITFTPVAQWGANGKVPTCTNPATAAGAAWKAPGSVGATDYVPKCTNPATAAGAGWIQASTIKTSDYVSLVDSNTAPTSKAWAQGPSRSQGSGGGGGANVPRAGATLITSCGFAAADEAPFDNDVVYSPCTVSYATGKKVTTIPTSYDDGQGTSERNLTTGFSTYKRLEYTFKGTHSAGWVGHNTGSNKMLGVWRGPGNTYMIWHEAGRAGSDPLKNTFGLMNIGGGDAWFDPNVVDVNLVRGVEHLYEVSVFLGTAGNYDGTLEAWVNGIKTHDYTGINFVPGGTTPVFTILSCQPIWGGNSGDTLAAPQTFAIDDLYIYGKAT